MKTTQAAKASDLERKWFVIDAQGKILGRLATKAARLLTGKDKPIFSPHVDCGDFVVVINAEKVAVTGSKLKDKMYYKHTGYVGHLKTANLDKMINEKPAQVIVKAVHGMVPKTRLGRRIMSKLKVYPGAEHPHAAQKPVVIE